MPDTYCYYLNNPSSDPKTVLHISSVKLMLTF